MKDYKFGNDYAAQSEFVVNKEAGYAGNRTADEVEGKISVKSDYTKPDIEEKAKVGTKAKGGKRK